jgi:competence protein CoiA
MQAYALDGTLPVAASRAEKGKNYSCPECGSSVRVRSGPARQIHFFHISLPKNCRQHQKSLEHLQLQLKIFELVASPNAQIECPFPAIQRIADVAWHDKKIVFEIQCSPIPREEAEKRNFDYHKAGYQTIWILHDKRFNKASLSAAEGYLRAAPCYFTCIDKTGMGGVYDQFEVLQGNRRLFKGPKLPIEPTHISFFPSTAPPDLLLPKIVLDRLTNWKCYLKGDLLHRLLKEGNLSQAAQKMIALETQFKNKKKAADIEKLSLMTLIAKSYLSGLDWLLKKIGDKDLS